MGSDNSRNSGPINVKIELFKTCYFPGELITGLLILTPKPGITDAIFSDTKSHFTISESHYYRYKTKEIITTYLQAIENNTLCAKDIFFDQFLSESILLEMKLPFSIQLPHNAYPSCFFTETLSYVCHNLQVEFPYIKALANRTFIVKNPQYFNNENGLLKEPCEISKKIYKSKFLKGKGSFSVLIKLAKNYFFYDEPINYEIDLDFSELDIELKELFIKIIKTTQRNNKQNHNKALIKNSEDLAIQKVSLNSNGNMKKFHFKDSIKIDKKLTPSVAYEYMDKNGPIEFNENNKNNFLTPSCYGGLLSVSYNLNIRIIFDTLWTLNEEFNIPIDFFEKQNNNINTINNNRNSISNNHNSEENNNTNTGDNDNSNNQNINDEGEDAPPPVHNVNNP